MSILAVPTTAENHVEALRSFERKLSLVHLEDDAVFRALLEEGMQLLQLSHQDVARAFGASLPTVHRWLDGRAVPHPASRTPVFDWLRRKVAFYL